MRNRHQRKRSTEGIAAMQPDSTNDPKTLTEQPEEEYRDDSQSDHGDVNSLPQPLARTTTREEITQTDDESTFPSHPQEKIKRSWIQYRRLVFVLGCIMGIALAWAFRSPDLQLEGLLDSVDVADFFDDLKAVLPSALSIGLLREAKEIQENSRQRASSGAFSVGEQMFQVGMSAYYPVVMVYKPCLLVRTDVSGPWRYLDWIGKLVNDQLFVQSLIIRGWYPIDPLDCPTFENGYGYDTLLS
jgi:hypothetical protein